VLINDKSLINDINMKVSAAKPKVTRSFTHLPSVFNKENTSYNIPDKNTRPGPG